MKQKIEKEGYIVEVTNKDNGDVHYLTNNFRTAKLTYDITEAALYESKEAAMDHKKIFKRETFMDYSYRIRFMRMDIYYEFPKY